MAIFCFWLQPVLELDPSLGPLALWADNPIMKLMRSGWVLAAHNALAPNDVVASFETRIAISYETRASLVCFIHSLKFQFLLVLQDQVVFVSSLKPAN